MPGMMESERKAELDQLGLLFTLLSPDSFEKFASSLEKEASKSLTKRILSQVSRQKLTAFINKVRAARSSRDLEMLHNKDPFYGPLFSYRILNHVDPSGKLSRHVRSLVRRSPVRVEDFEYFTGRNDPLSFLSPVIKTRKSDRIGNTVRSLLSGITERHSNDLVRLPFRGVTKKEILDNMRFIKRSMRDRIKGTGITNRALRSTKFFYDLPSVRSVAKGASPSKRLLTREISLDPDFDAYFSAVSRAGGIPGTKKSVGRSIFGLKPRNRIIHSGVVRLRDGNLYYSPSTVLHELGHASDSFSAGKVKGFRYPPTRAKGADINRLIDSPKELASRNDGFNIELSAWDRANIPESNYVRNAAVASHRTNQLLRTLSNTRKLSGATAKRVVETIRRDHG